MLSDEAQDKLVSPLVSMLQHLAPPQVGAHDLHFMQFLLCSQAQMFQMVVTLVERKQKH